MSSRVDHTVIRPMIRPDRRADLRDYVEDCLKAWEADLIRTCLTCVSFREFGVPPNANGPGHPDAYCGKFGMQPPARVIAYGCPGYLSDDEIPF